MLEFDNGGGYDVKKVMWGDRFQFATLSVPLTRDSEWTWNVANKKGRYNALVAGPYEMGLFEPTPFRATSTRDGWSDNRGSTSSLRPDGEGCGGGQNLPSDWEWPYQSVQYSLPCKRTGTTSFKKMSWGTTSFYGAGNAISTVFDSPTTSSPFVGYPSSKILKYDVCLVLGRTTTYGLTRTAARLATINCATETP